MTVNRTANASDLERLSELATPRLIVSDIDGTLVDRHERITDRTRRALNAARAAGSVVVLATGRPPRAVTPIVEQLDFAPLAVCANGAVLYDSAAAHVLDVRVLDSAVLAELAEIAFARLPGVGLAVERVELGQHDAATPVFLSAPGYEHAWIEPSALEVSAPEILAGPAVKMLVRVPGATSDDMRAAIGDSVGHLADVTYATANGLIEFHAPGVSKATGIAGLASRGLLPDISPSVAFGDMPNDAAMLAWATVGVAMGNAHLDARAAASVVTATNADDGVAQVLERWFG